MGTVREVLQIDSKCRKDNIQFDLFKLNSIKKVSYNYNFPTLVNKNSELYKINYECVNDILNDLVFLGRLDFKNIIIAGGYICNKLIFRNTDTCDVDIFIYGLSNHKATNKIHYILKLFNIQTIYRSKYSINFTYRNRKIQIILRLYKTFSSVLHGFDLGSSAVGYNGHDIYFTSLSKFSYEHGLNIVDTTRRSTTYEKRLIKYFNRGFDIVVPNLKIPNSCGSNSQSNEWCIELPYISFIVTCKKDNFILCEKIELIKDNFSKNYTKDYSTCDYDSFEQNSGQKIIRVIKMFSQLIKDGFISSEVDVDEMYKPILTIEKLEIFISSIYDQIKTPKLEKIEKLRQKYNEYIKKVEKINWISTNVGRQFTSSINPIIEDSIEWYGLFYNEILPPIYKKKNKIGIKNLVLKKIRD